MEKLGVIVGLISLIVPVTATWYCLDEYHHPVPPGHTYLAGCYECLCRYPQETICRRRLDQYPHIDPDFGIGASYPIHHENPMYPVPHDSYPPIRNVYPPVQNIHPPIQNINPPTQDRYPPIQIYPADNVIPKEEVQRPKNVNPTPKVDPPSKPIFPIDPVKTIPH